MAIRLTDERLAHILDHPEMAGMQPAIADTLARPQEVRQARGDDHVQLYYRLYFGTPVGDKLLCVVVKEVPDDAFVITAYLTDRMKKGAVTWNARS